MKKENCRVGQKCENDWDIPDISLPEDLKDLKAKLVRPGGKTDEIPLIASPVNTLACEFTPSGAGIHKIEVTKSGREVIGCPQ